MSNNAFKISLTYKQILDLVRQLPKKDKARLSNELAKEITDKRLSRLLDTFRTDELSEEEINQEVEDNTSLNF
ncbi:MAG: type II toxin-antitoxin system VapB15 family antitoxin [Mangrovibacterium sp.]